MNSLFLDALRGVNKDRPPVWLMRQAGRYMPSYQKLRSKYSFLEMCHTPDLVETITHLPVNELLVDAAIVFSDILMVPEAIGFKVRFDEGIGPIIENHLKTPKEIESFSLSHLSERLDYLGTSIGALKKTLKVPLIGFAGAPFTLASYLIEGKTSRDHKLTKKWIYQEEESFQKIIHLLERACSESLLLQIKAGCDAVQIFDSWAGILSEPHFEKWCLKSLTNIVRDLKPYNVPIIYFCRGSSYLAPLIAKSGVSAISLDWQRPLAEVRKMLPKTPLQGNLDPEALYSAPKDLEKAVTASLKSMKDDPAYTFNLGHGILPDVPYDNVKRLVEIVNQTRF